VRVLLACPYAWDAPGGVQVHVRQLAVGLTRRGHEVLVLAPARGRVTDPLVRVVGRAVAVPYQGTVAPISPWPTAVPRVARAIAAFKPDVIHAHEPLTPSTAMFAVIRSRGVPAAATFHAYAERSALLDAAAPLLRRVWRRLAVRIAVSEAAAAFVRSRFRGDVRIIPNGVDVALFRQGRPASDLPGGRRMLWVGRLDRQKGFPVAVGAFGALAQEFPDLVFVVIGEGRDRVAIDALDGQTRARVVMRGPLPHELLPAYHAGADLYVSPALGQESFGLVLVEAMAAGVPVVAGATGALSELVDAAGLVPPGDAGALADAARRRYADAAAGDAGLARIRELAAPDVVAARLATVYAGVRESAALP
jgi:phosphatidyl-myo-inositol alpha-mannosyltransferase